MGNKDQINYLTSYIQVHLRLTYSELSHKTRFQIVLIAALCLYNMQRENLVFKNSPWLHLKMRS